MWYFVVMGQYPATTLTKTGNFIEKKKKMEVQREIIPKSGGVDTSNCILQNSNI